MVTKFMSLAALISSVAIFLTNLSNPSDPLFFIASGGIVLCILRVLLTTLFAVLTFVELPRNRSFRIALGVFGLPLIIMGAIGFITDSFNFAWYGLLKPLDYLLIIETGIIMNILALEPQRHVTYNYDSLLPLPTHNRFLLISAFKLHTKKLKSAS